MNEKDIKKLKELAEKKLAKGISQEEALHSLQRAGILDTKGNFTTPYQNLGKAITSYQEL